MTITIEEMKNLTLRVTINFVTIELEDGLFLTNNIHGVERAVSMLRKFDKPWGRADVAEEMKDEVYFLEDGTHLIRITDSVKKAETKVIDRVGTFSTIEYVSKKWA